MEAYILVIFIFKAHEGGIGGQMMTSQCRKKTKLFITGRIFIMVGSCLQYCYDSFKMPFFRNCMISYASGFSWPSWYTSTQNLKLVFTFLLLLVFSPLSYSPIRLLEVCVPLPKIFIKRQVPLKVSLLQDLKDFFQK